MQAGLRQAPRQMHAQATQKPRSSQEREVTRPRGRQQVRDQINRSGMLPRRHGFLVALLALLAWSAFFAATAKADLTHKYLGQIMLASGTNPQPVGVDNQGNI